MLPNRVQQRHVSGRPWSWWVEERPVGREDPEHGRLGTRRFWRRERCLGTALLLCLLCFLGVRASRAPTEHPLMFKAAQVLTTAADARETQSVLRARMLALLHERPSLCGVAAPNLGVYQRYAILRRETGELVDVFNPVVDSIEHLQNKNITVNERSIMCEGQQRHPHVRHSAVWVTHVNVLWQHVSSLWTKQEAFCLQHFLDLFEGLWPCASVGEDRWRVPRHARELTEL